MISFFLLAALAVEPLPEPSEDALVVEVPRRLRELALPLGDGVLEALRTRDHDAAVAGLSLLDVDAMPGSQRADHAFLMAWSLVHAKRADEAGPWVERMGNLGTAPVPYRAIVRAEVLRASGELERALVALDDIDDDDVVAPRAWVVHAEILRDLERLGDASELYARIVSRPDPADGNDYALGILAKRRGHHTEGGREALRRLWAWYPGSRAGRTAADVLNGDSAFQPTGAELARRAERWMAYGDWNAAIRAAEAALPKLREGTEEACRARYALGRSHYKKNQLSNAVDGFADAGRDCADLDVSYGYKSLYLQGMAQFRKGQYGTSAATYRRIAELYPEASYADDGLTRAGIALQENGDLEGAIRTWREALERFPDGDTVPEATFRLAFHLYDVGRPDEAIAEADRVASLPVGTDPDSVLGGMYWAARWRLYPDVTQPAAAVDDPSRRAEAIERWSALVRDYPFHYYATVGFSRLTEVAPEVASELLAVTREPAPDLPWRVRTGVFNHPSIGYGVALMRLGLVKESLAEWNRVTLTDLTPEERAWLAELERGTGDWLWSSKTMHYYLCSHPPGSLGERQADVLDVGYPDHWWDEVREAAAGYDYPPRMFHGVVREESNFDPKIKSHAGAIGLSQLMPATARTTAGWLGRSVSTSQLTDPVTNLTIGARYFQAVYEQVGDNPYLAMASYNAGPARVTRWAREWGQPPLDEYVERIPFRETRGYVKRVTSAWQTMRYIHDRDQAPFTDLSRFNHSVAVP